MKSHKIGQDNRLVCVYENTNGRRHVAKLIFFYNFIRATRSYLLLNKLYFREPIPLTKACFFVLAVRTTEVSNAQDLTCYASANEKHCIKHVQCNGHGMRRPALPYHHRNFTRFFLLKVMFNCSIFRIIFLQIKLIEILFSCEP